MHIVIHNNEQIAIAQSKDDAVSALLERVDGSIIGTKIRPDVLTAGGKAPWCSIDQGERVNVLNDVCRDYIDIAQIARERVLAELEYIKDEDDTPAAVHPTDSDDWQYDIDDWVSENVEVDHFEDGVISAVQTQLEDACYDEIHACWNEITDDIGNPATAINTQIQRKIQELEKRD